MKKYFKIGEIAKLYHIGTDSLRYYEKLGILTPKRSENDYRLYSLHDIWRLNVIRDLRNLDFSMEQIKDYLNNRSITSTESLFEQELSGRIICAERKCSKSSSDFKRRQAPSSWHHRADLSPYETLPYDTVRLPDR